MKANPNLDESNRNAIGLQVVTQLCLELVNWADPIKKNFCLLVGHRNTIESLGT